MDPEPIGVVVRVAQALEDLGIPYLVGGSYASSQYGLPRTTQVVDLVVDLRQKHVLPLVRALQGEFYIDENMIRQAIRHRTSFNVIHFQAGYKIDVFIAETTPWARQEMARRRVEKIGTESAPLYFCSPEDVILHKLDWFRKGGGVSDRQWSDVRGVLEVQAALLDASYLREWAGVLGLTDLLERALREAEVKL
jgi:hypothetical protein